MSNLIESSTKSISQYLIGNQMQEYLRSVLGAKKDNFVTNLVSIYNQSKELQECSQKSLVSGAIVATTLNLSLNKSFGYAYLVPYKKKNRSGGIDSVEAQFQIGFKGYIQLAMRTGQYKKINAVPIYENQFVSWSPMSEELSLNDVEGNSEIVGYAAYFQLLNGFEKTMFWRYDKMLKHADEFSQAFNATALQKLKDGEIPQDQLWKFSSYWYKNFDEMALKTMLRQLLSKYGILSEEMQSAYESDQQVIVDGVGKYVDSRSTETDVIPQEDAFDDTEEAKVVDVVSINDV